MYGFTNIFSTWNGSSGRPFELSESYIKRPPSLYQQYQYNDFTTRRFAGPANYLPTQPSYINEYAFTGRQQNYIRQFSPTELLGNGRDVQFQSNTFVFPYSRGYGY